MVKLKNNNIIIIAGSIILGAVIISLSINKKSTSSLDHCYKKVYKNQLNEELAYIKKNPNFTKEWAEAEAAKYARRRCLK